MPNTIVNIPFLIGDLPYTVDVLNPADLSVLQGGIALSDVAGIHQGIVTGPHSGKLIFAVKHAGHQVDHRVRTIADDNSTYLILSGLDGNSGQLGVTLPVNPSDDDINSTGYLIAYDNLGKRENNVGFTVQLTAGPGVAGISLDTAPRTNKTADITIGGETVKGYVEFAGLRRGATYTIRRGPVAGADPVSFGSRSTGSGVSFTVPDAPSFAIIETLGSE